MPDNEVIILDELNFMWKKRDINKVVKLHNDDKSLNDISKIMKCVEAEILLILVHVALKGEQEIKPLKASD